MPATKPGSLADLARQCAADYPEITTPYDLVEKLVTRHPELELAYSRDSMRKRCAEAIAARDAVGAEPNAPDSTSGTMRDESTGGKRTIESVESDTIRTLEGLLEACHVDPLEWSVERHIINKWDVTMSGPEGPQVATNWQVKATLVPNTRLTELTVAEIAATLAPLVAKGGYGFRPKKEVVDKGYLLELDLFDIHLGKLCDPLEGGPAYNLDIAADVFNSAIDTLVQRASGFPVERVLLPIGNDFFNSDSLANMTTKGTPQHESAKWQRVFATGCALVTDVVNRLRRRGYCVDVVIVSGNHDFQRAFYLGQVLEAAFAGCADVTVDNSHTARKYYVWNDCALLLTHGNEEKEGDLPQIFAAEKPAIWGATTFREIHLGHRHHKKEVKYRSSEEYKGVTVRYIRSLSATDEWHRTKGYIGSQRSAEAFVWSAGEGVVAHFTNTISSTLPLAA